MFSYCNRGLQGERFSEKPFQYQMSSLNTLRGFGKPPMFCPSLQMPYVSSRGLPRHLLDKEAKLKGQDYHTQPFCANPENEGDKLDFSPFKWLQEQPLPTRAPVPCAPTPFIEVKQYGGSACDHVGGVTPCGHSCSCSPRCQCKELWRDRNMTKPAIGVLPMHKMPGCRI
jgi:hypothetical protein